MFKNLVKKFRGQKGIRVIRQIIPGNGWFAVYAVDSALNVAKHPLVAWALVHHRAERFSEVVGIDSEGHLCDEWTNFVGYVHETESPTKWSDRAAKILEGGILPPQFLVSYSLLAAEAHNIIRKDYRGIWRSLIYQGESSQKVERTERETATSTDVA